MKCAAILIGTSAGGVAALHEIFSTLSPKAPPLLVVQHMPADATLDMNLVFGRSFSGPLLEGADKTKVQNGHAYFAPPGYHLLLERDLTLSLSQDDLVNFARPSIDLLFQSGAAALGAAACGVLLTGANNDGAEGLQCIQEAGGITIVQDPKSADAPYMPNAALAIMKPSFVLPLKQIAGKLNEIVEGRA